MTSSLGGVPLTKLYCHVPPSGAWWAEVAFASGQAPAIGPATLTVLDLALVGKVVRSGEDAPGEPWAIVRGAAGLWEPLLRGESWQSDEGVRLKTVLTVLARATGETLTLPTDANLGEAYGWPSAGPQTPSTGLRVLDDVVRRGAVPTWRVEPAGAVRFDAWPASDVADARGRVSARRLAFGRRQVGLDNAARAFLPGAILEGVPVVRVTFREHAGEAQAEVWES